MCVWGTYQQLSICFTLLVFHYKLENDHSLFLSFYTLSSLAILIILSSLATLVSTNNETDRLSLLAFKSGITQDPLGVMASWNSSIHFCHWYGVTCGLQHQRVTILDLPSLKLSGSISPHIGNLTFLRNITLENNIFSGQIPQELGRLHRLKHLYLGSNSLIGEIPTNLSSCLNLIGMRLANNQLSGRIPPEIGSLINLRRLGFDKNNLTGNIPLSFGNLSSLEILSAPSNRLSGRIPPALGGLQNLSWIEFGGNDLDGSIPPPIFNLSSMVSFGVADNRLHGSLPSELGNLFPNIQYFAIFGNQFIGSIPPSISNASNLDSLYLHFNKLTGQVPYLGNLRQLRTFSVVGNLLGSAGKTRDLDFLSDLTNATNLERFQAGLNNFGGVLPHSIANLSSTTLTTLGIESNEVVGTLPTAIGNLASMESLSLWGNRLSGGIPDDIGKLHKLQRLYLDHSDFTENIPSSVGNLSMLTELTLSGNKLQGRIPSTLGNCQRLLRLEMYDNNLNGSIPVEIFTISSLTLSLDLSGNQFTGALPSEVGNLKNLGSFNISHNMISGEIPKSLGDCRSMGELDASANLFHGKIPSPFAALRGLKYLNLSRNNLSGEIPSFLQTIALETLDLSFNNFSGELPSGGIFKNASATSFQENNMLCGGTPELHLPVCPSGEPKERRLIKNPKIIVAIVLSALAILLTVCLLVFWFCKKKSKGIGSVSSENTILQVSYQFLSEATDGFAATNLIGNGSFSSVYKGILDLQRTVAVKVFNLQRRGASRSFLAECEALRNIRHRNLVKVITVCSSIDFHGDDFKALVYEFMVNGNLDQWLHPPSDDTTRKLSLVQRIDISIDIARGLNYMHHEHGQTSIVHCDLKPSNILLDDEMMAKVGDFGLVKFLSDEINHLSASSLGVRGTVGYAAPEYGMGSDVSTGGDMYSFGILLLEMFTEKRPTDDMFDNSMNLHNFVKIALQHNVAEIMDPTLVEGIEDEKVIESLVAIYEIGVACSEDMPRERMDINSALAKLIAVRDNLQQVPEAQPSSVTVGDIA